MERFFSKKSVAVFLTTIILFGFLNIHSANAGGWLWPDIDKVASDILNGLASGIATLYSWALNLVVIPIASFCLAAVGIILDYSIEYTIYGKGFGAMDGAIRAIWTLLRDTANITFIFFLLYAGIQQIISGSMKKDLLVSVIMTAVLINFSLFTTKILIDAGNLVTTAIYKQIAAGGPSGNATKALLSGEGILSSTSGLKSSIDLSGGIMASLDITTIFDVTGSGATLLEDSTVGDGTNSINGVGGMINSTLKVFKILALFYVFMFLAVMFIGRYVTLVILMATSPMGFIFGNIPGLSKWSGSWRSQLTEAIMIAPTIMFLLLITIRLSQYLPPSNNVFISIFNFIFVIYTLNKSMSIVKSMSGEFGAMADTIGKAAAGLAVAGVTGGAAFAARGVVGGAANSMAASKWGTRLQGLAVGDSKIGRGVGKFGTSILNAGATSSFDVRNAPGYGNLIGGPLGLQADSKLAGKGLNQGGQRADIEAGVKKAKETAEQMEKDTKAYQAKFVDQEISDKLRGKRSALEGEMDSATPERKEELRKEINKINLEIKGASKDAGATLEKIQKGVKQEDFTEAEDKIKKAKAEMEESADAIKEKQDESDNLDKDIIKAEEAVMMEEKGGITKESLEKRDIVDKLKKKAEAIKKQVAKSVRDSEEKTKAHDKANEDLAKLNEEQIKATEARESITENLDRAVDAKNRRNDIAREYRAGGLTGLFRRGFVTNNTANQMSEAGEKVTDKPKTKDEKAKEREIEQQAKIYAKAQKEEGK